jgi:hypothetical protein
MAPDLTPNALEVRRLVYDRLMSGGAIPPRAALSSAAALSLAETSTALQELAAAHMLVLQRDGEILMANPFSAVPTPFVVSAGGHTWFANCIWDAMGISAMLHREAVVEASCGCCGSALTLRVPGDCTADERVAHFAIPAAHWWDDIVFN